MKTGTSCLPIAAQRPAPAQAGVEARAAELIAEELSLQELRKAMRLTQAELAKRLGVRQDTISRAEQRADMLLSTLQSHVEAMGGRLALVAELPNCPPVRIKTLSTLAGETKGRRGLRFLEPRTAHLNEAPAFRRPGKK
jgi:transcriptional regulator with XRE-family HTH domain